jgi:hypothetical protein
MYFSLRIHFILILLTQCNILNATKEVFSRSKKTGKIIVQLQSIYKPNPGEFPRYSSLQITSENLSPSEESKNPFTQSSTIAREKRVVKNM